MFAKVFQSMYDGSLGTRGPWEALITFQQLLIMSDRFGDVDMTAEVISRRTLIPINIIQKGITELLKPDEHSRDPSEEGRRIVPISDTRDWGWHIVNYTKYSAIRSAEDRREYKRSKYQETKAAQPAATFQTPDWIPLEPWRGWLEMRKKMRFPPTQRALTLAVSKLKDLKDKGHDVAAVLDEATLKCWRGIFEPKSNGGSPSEPAPKVILCGGCGKPITGGWTNAGSKGRLCDPCYRAA